MGFNSAFKGLIISKLKEKLSLFALNCNSAGALASLERKLHTRSAHHATLQRNSCVRYGTLRRRTEKRRTVSCHKLRKFKEQLSFVFVLIS